MKKMKKIKKQQQQYEGEMQKVLLTASMELAVRYE